METTYEIEVFRRGGNVAFVFPNSDLLETQDGRLAPAIMVSGDDAIELIEQLGIAIRGLMVETPTDTASESDRGDE